MPPPPGLVDFLRGPLSIPCSSSASPLRSSTTSSRSSLPCALPSSPAAPPPRSPRCAWSRRDGRMEWCRCHAGVCVHGDARTRSAAFVWRPRRARHAGRRAMARPREERSGGKRAVGGTDGGTLRGGERGGGDWAGLEEAKTCCVAGWRRGSACSCLGHARWMPCSGALRDERPWRGRAPECRWMVDGGPRGCVRRREALNPRRCRCCLHCWISNSLGSATRRSGWACEGPDLARAALEERSRSELSGLMAGAPSARPRGPLLPFRAL